MRQHQRTLDAEIRIWNFGQAFDPEAASTKQCAGEDDLADLH